MSPRDLLMSLFIFARESRLLIAHRSVFRPLAQINDSMSGVRGSSALRLFVLLFFFLGGGGGSDLHFIYIYLYVCVCVCV